MTDLLVRLGDASILKNGGGGGGILVMDNGFEMREGGGLYPFTDYDVITRNPAPLNIYEHKYTV